MRDTASLCSENCIRVVVGGGPGAGQLGSRRGQVVAPGLTLVIADVSSYRKPEQLSLSSVIALSLHLLFASHFLVITVSIVTISRDNGNKAEEGFFPPASDSHMETEVGVSLRAEGGDSRPEREPWLQIEASSAFGPMKPTLQLPDSFFPSLLECGYDISSG